MQEKWSDEEHARFVKAIESYGRDWGKIVAHIGTRTVAQVRFLSLMARQLSEGVLSASQLLEPWQTLPAEIKSLFEASSRIMRCSAQQDCPSSSVRTSGSTGSMRAAQKLVVAQAGLQRHFEPVWDSTGAAMWVGAGSAA